MEGLHSHCLKCINRRCMVRPEAGICCNLICCPLVCGAVFHSCKLEEHRLLCPYERLPCLNSVFGCPFTIARIRMAKHLATCPASIVCCTMEWNRWPVSYSDRKSYENLSKDFDEVEQLDMALALQDQRMLLESLKVTTTVSKTGDKEADKSNKMATASSLPGAVLGNAAVEMEEEPYSGSYRPSVDTSRSLAAALDILSNGKDIEVIVGNLNGEKNGDLRNVYVAEGVKNVDMQESDSDSECELGAVGGVDCAVGTDGEEDAISWAEENDFVELFFEEKEKIVEEPINESNRVWPEMPQSYMPVVALEPPVPQRAPVARPMPFLLSEHVRNNFLQHLPSELRYRCLERKLQSVEVLRGISMFTFNGRRALLSDPYLFRAKMEDKSVDTSDLEVADDPMGLHGIDLITAALLFCLGDSPGGRGISDSRFVDGYHIDFGTQTFSFPSAILATNTMVGDIGSASACDHASPQLSNPSPFHTLRLDLVLECVARYQTKQRSMFTFVCGQLFRRDEFSSHFKNVHGDIHAGLNGWMEQRCPLAYYGCTYSQRRFCPSVQGFRIIHDRHLGSFGVQPGLPLKAGDDLPRKPYRFGSQCDQFSSLPFEVLQRVASFLDSFSLCQLSRVSHTMRDVCASLLMMRGMVVLLWEKKRRADGSPSWQITDKVWRFSTAFGTVNEWKFANIASMADHLKKCQFNKITRQEEAIPLPCMCFTRELTKEGRCLRSVLKPVA
ncbi:F-box only protein 30a [Anarrhichthys ocellatus]|uniref:F-box only protein 30a n=1 Tax=Anarrhichthys ocellatus TaxID=433405 RepID=UPI0012EE004A|nr:F-box only protein 30-like [Anarrhichthys ocellatus]XP_031703217.1 F-box only protein 30-like [Anarrhichthys ocellatus]